MVTRPETSGRGSSPVLVYVLRARLLSIIAYHKASGEMGARPALGLLTLVRVSMPLSLCEGAAYCCVVLQIQLALCKSALNSGGTRRRGAVKLREHTSKWLQVALSTL